MSGRNAVTLSILLALVLILTVSVAGAVPRSPVLGGLAPILILTVMTWYLIVLIVDRDRIIAALAAMFKLQGKPKPLDKTNFWLTIAVYAAILGLGMVALWTGLPQRILSRMQGIATNFISGSENTPSFRPQLGPIGIASHHASHLLWDTRYGRDSRGVIQSNLGRSTFSLSGQKFEFG